MAGQTSLDPKGSIQTLSGIPGQDVLATAIDHLKRMRFFRKQLDQRWAYFYRQYLGQRDTRYFPDNATPRSNTFISYPYSNVETVVARTQDAFFSYMPWFECTGRTSQDDPASEAMQQVLSQLLLSSNFLEAFETLVRNTAIYGHAGIKVDWDFDFDVIHYKEPVIAQQPVLQPVVDPQTGQPKLDANGQPQMHPVINPQTGQPATQPIIDPQTGDPKVLAVKPATKLVPRSRPKFTPIDVYDLLIDPDGGIVAQLTERTFGQMLREQAMSLQMDPDKPMYFPQGLATLQQKLANEANPQAVIIRMAEVWNEYDKQMTLCTFGEDYEAVSWKDLRMSYRALTYSTYKRKFYMGEPILLYHGEFPYQHKRIPILSTSYSKLPNEIFGLGVIEPISDLVESLNKFVNMIADNWNLGINRRYAVDSNADVDHDALDNMNSPGGKVMVNGNPNEVIKELPTHTPVAGDYQVLDLYKGVIEMTSGISDFYSKGLGSPVGNRTATGISSIIQETNTKFKMFIRNLELDILQPLLKQCSSLVQQYLTSQQEVMLTGQQNVIPKRLFVQPEQLIGNYEFTLMAANYASNKAIRQRNYMALMNVAAQSPFLNQYEGLRELFKNFEIRNADKLLKTPEQVQQEEQEQMAQQVKMMLLESMLNTEKKARLSQATPTKLPGKEGRPAKYQLEGKIPGAGLTTMIRNVAQSLGGNALGFGGMGEVPGK